MKSNLKSKLKNFFKFDIEEDLKEEPTKKFESVTLFTLNRNKLFISILAFLLLINILVIFDLNQFYIRAILAFIFLITIPGLLIMLALRIRNINFWEYLVYVVGLSVAFIMFAGLHANWTLPAFGIIDKPLSTIPILIEFDIFLLILGFFAYIRNSDLKFKIKFPKFSWLDRIFIIVPMIFPVLSVLGAFLLNNHGPNILTMIMLGGIAVYVFMVVLFREKLNENVFPWAILMVGLALSLMFSLRSWFISGYDISKEYQIFQLTKERGFWSISNFRHAYNACLSITILPTIFYSFLKINEEHIFKLFIPIIFSFIIIIIYALSKKQTMKILAFLTGFFFLSQPWFIDPMMTLARQQIAFLFFGLMLLALFSKEINPTLKKTLFLIFGFSMIVSHYSTSYIALAIFLLTYIMIFFYKLYENRKIKKGKLKLEQREQFYLTGVIILLLLIFGFLWYSQLTPTANNLIDLVDKTIGDIGKIFVDEMRSGPLKKALYGRSTISMVTFEDYFENKTIDYQKKQGIKLYDEKLYNDYKIVPNFSKSLLKENTRIKEIFSFLYQVIMTLIKIFFLLGMIYLLLKNSTSNKLIKEYIVLTIISMLFVGLFILLPLISLRYNFDRIYLQVMILGSLINVFGGIVLFKLIFKRNFSSKIITVIFILFFLYSFGFIWQISGDLPDIWLNNQGPSYDTIYTHKTEVNSASWLLNSYNYEIIYSNDPGRNKLWAFSGINNVITDTLPSTITRDAIVYLTYTNIFEKRAFFSYNGQVLSYNFPTEFLNDNKNKIYNNGGSEIFK